ncbi:MAG: hypothetical protein JW932_19070 [Deltaproteobacteria bacterium]|nr:hypothetical protein [Deltaproteobacteria bacterium]
MTNINLETCIIEIKKAIARIEEQTKTIFKALAENKDWAAELHKKHFDIEEKLRCSMAEFNVRLSQHDVELRSMKRTIHKIGLNLERLSTSIARTRGIAIGLGMAGGAIVSILTIVIQFFK